MQTAVKAGEPSDPYLMTGYDRKRVELSHDSDGPVTMRIEVDVFNGGYWKTYQEIVVPAGEIVEHVFDDSFVHRLGASHRRSRLPSDGDVSLRLDTGGSPVSAARTD